MTAYNGEPKIGLISRNWVFVSLESRGKSPSRIFASSKKYDWVDPVTTDPKGKIVDVRVLDT
jgi:hypothetical protein